MKKYILFSILVIFSIPIWATGAIIQCPPAAECDGHAPNQVCYAIGQFSEYFDKYISPIEAAKVEGKYNLLLSVNLKKDVVNCLYLYEDGTNENYPTLSISGKIKYRFTAELTPDSGWGKTSQQNKDNNFCSMLNNNKCPLNIN